LETADPRFSIEYSVGTSDGRPSRRRPGNTGCWKTFSSGGFRTTGVYGGEIQLRFEFR
jgi:hypothetical protein